MAFSWPVRRLLTHRIHVLLRNGSDIVKYGNGLNRLFQLKIGLSFVPELSYEKRQAAFAPSVVFVFMAEIQVKPEPFFTAKWSFRGTALLFKSESYRIIICGGIWSIVFILFYRYYVYYHDIRLDFM